jgi:hypothetical protein
MGLSKNSERSGKELAEGKFKNRRKGRWDGG